MKIGVIIPVYNARPWIQEMLESIENQSYQTFTYLSEDGSTDGTYEFLLENKQWYTKMVRNKLKVGWHGGLNVAAELAFADGCDLIFTASADDKMHVDCIKRCLDLMREKNYNFVIPYNKQFDQSDHIQISYDDVTFADLVTWPMMTDKALIKREVWETVGGYSLDVGPPNVYGCAEDWEFWIKVWKANLNKYGVVKEPLYFVRVHDNQLSNTRESHHKYTVELFKAKHPDLPWTEDSGKWPPKMRGM